MTNKTNQPAIFRFIICIYYIDMTTNLCRWWTAGYNYDLIMMIWPWSYFDIFSEKWLSEWLVVTAAGRHFSIIDMTDIGNSNIWKSPKYLISSLKYSLYCRWHLLSMNYWKIYTVVRHIDLLFRCRRLSEILVCFEIAKDLKEMVIE